MFQSLLQNSDFIHQISIPTHLNHSPAVILNLLSCPQVCGKPWEVGRPGVQNLKKSENAKWSNFPYQELFLGFQASQNHPNNCFWKTWCECTLLHPFLSVARRVIRNAPRIKVKNRNVSKFIAEFWHQTSNIDPNTSQALPCCYFDLTFLSAGLREALRGWASRRPKLE